MFRTIVLATVLCVAANALAEDKTSAPARRADTMTPTGLAVGELAAFDRLVPEFMREFGIPGGAVAVGHGERLVFAHGYGVADVEADEPVRPESLFRLASVSKPITALAVMRLVEEQRLSLDDTVCKLLDDFDPAENEACDERLRLITLRQLLNHTGGWDRDKSFDPMFRSTIAAEAVGAAPPADAYAVIRYMRTIPLDFAPGERHAYSNFGYCLLGRVIEKVTGRDYQTAVRELVLEPAGIQRMRLGHTKLGDRAPGEVRYYHHTADELANSVFSGDKGLVPWTYGGFYIEAMDAHGGWLASAVDLVRLVMALDTAERPLLRPETLAAMVDESNRAPINRPGPAGRQFYGLGWTITSRDEGVEWSHGGSLPGTSTVLVRRADGVCYAALFNYRPNGDTRAYAQRLQAMLRQAISEVSDWPEHDLPVKDVRLQSQTN